jgi:hypothetical protein
MAFPILLVVLAYDQATDEEFRFTIKMSTMS